MIRFSCILKSDGEPVEETELRSMMEAEPSTAVSALLPAESSIPGFWTQNSVGISGCPVLAAGDVRLAANLRLDGRRELLASLASMGGVQLDVATGSLQRESDAGLLLLAYRVWGEEAFSNLLGDISCVLWDGKKQTLYAYRSLFGIKPLAYARVGGHTYITSEVQQLLRLSAIPTRLDEVALADYLMDDSRDEHSTLFADIRHVPPGHLLIARGRGVELRSVWRPDLAPRIFLPRQEDYAVAFYEIFRQAVGDRLRTSAPSVGLLMSGGLDSCSVAAMTHDLLEKEGRGRHLTAFTYTFPTLPSCDEGEYVGVLAQELGVEIRPVNAEESWLFEDAETFEPHVDSPFLSWEGTDRRVFRQMQEAGSDVLLTGHGGDNIAPGTVRIFLSLMLRGRLAASLGGLQRHAHERGISLPQAAYRYLLGPLLPRAVNSGLRSLARRSQAPPLPSWILPSFAQRTGMGQRRFRRVVPRRFLDPARQTLFELLATLDSVGRACAGHARTGSLYGVEVRHPFLDRRLADFVLAIPPEVLFRGGERKVLLREALAGLLPEAIRQRQGKTSFADYLDRSLGRQAKERISSLLEDPILGQIGVVDGVELRRSYEGYCRGENPQLRSHLWFVITAEAWLRRCLSEKSPFRLEVFGRP